MPLLYDLFHPKMTRTISLSLLRNFLVGENIRKLFNHLKTAFKLLIFISRRKFDLFSFKALTWLPIFYCCLIVVAPNLNECCWRAIRAPTDTFLVDHSYQKALEFDWHELPKMVKRFSFPHLSMKTWSNLGCFMKS